MKRYWKFWDNEEEYWMLSDTNSNGAAFLFAAMGWTEITKEEYDQLLQEALENAI